jgi:transposase-like protein
MKRQRRTFTKQLKHEIVQSWSTGKMSIEEIEKKYQISRHLVARWKSEQISHAVQNGSAHSSITPFVPPSQAIHPQVYSNDPRDRLIGELNAELGRMYMKIRQLETQLGYSRRAGDAPIIPFGEKELVR